MIIAICQLNPIIGNIPYNKNKIIEGYRKGVAAGADLVVCPELSLLGYPPLDFVEKQGFREKVYAAAAEIAAQTGETGLIFGTIYEDIDNIGTNLFNVAMLCYNGKAQFVQKKTLLPNYDVFDEMRYFESAPAVFLHEFKGEKLGISICEDIWNDKDYWKKRMYPNDPVDRLIQKGATVLINISASPYSYGKRAERKEMLSVLTEKDGLPLVYACCAGAQTDLIFDGASMCFDKHGNLVKIGTSFDEDFILFDTEERSKPVFSVEDTFEKEVYNALVFGLREYCNKLRFKDILIGLSGGMDSAVVAAIAVDAIGSERVHTIMLPSVYSSEGSITDSEVLAKNLGIDNKEISITPLFETLKQSLTPMFAGKKEDVTEENMQSRIRGMLLMSVANKLGYLLLTTGNKSEIATGYATLYGDMCGGLAVIGDVYKTDVYRLAQYINRNGEVIPENVFVKPPSAELRPNQKDQDSLPPYDVLDKILWLYLEHNEEIDEISKSVPDRELVKSILTLVDKNEFKRKQGAPILRVSYKSFGYGRRFPIVQGWHRE